MASIPAIDAHRVCEMLVFWRRKDESTFGANFLIAICQSRQLFSHYMIKDCAVFADFVLLFCCVLLICISVSEPESSSE